VSEFGYLRSSLLDSLVRSKLVQKWLSFLEGLNWVDRSVVEGPEIPGSRLFLC
jgi:hypothetical protein